MIGAIIIWSGLTAHIPAGWQICDGTNGTPNLRGLFIKGAVHDNVVGNTGGSDRHSHSFTGDGHDHDILGGTGYEAGPGGDIRDRTTKDEAIGTTDSADGQPPWCKLFYIQRIS